jgi:AcrR family transcriptional regulator
MPRTAPPDRFEQVIDAATRVFIELGYRRTQMEDVAKAAGLAKGTLYLYVASKEALFELGVRYADAPRPIEAPSALPVTTPQKGSTLRAVRGRLLKERRPPALSTALGKRVVADAHAELEAIVRELYSLLYRHRTGIKLIDRCAQDYPELAALWFQSGRYGLVELLARYLRARIRRKALPGVVDVSGAARFVLETIVFWAVHRHWDPSPQSIDERAVEKLVVDLVCRALGARAR